MRRISAAKHSDRPMGSRHGASEIVHQLLDSAAAGETLAKERFFKHWCNLASDEPEHRANSDGAEAFSLSPDCYVVN
jgi:hypothetical protein